MSVILRQTAVRVVSWLAMLAAGGTLLAQRPDATTQAEYLPPLDALLWRIEQQQAELQALRAELGSLQNEVRLLPAPDYGSPTASAAPLPSIVGSPTEDSAVGELRMRMASMEQRLEQQQAAQPANAPLAEDEGYEVGSDLAMSASWNNGLELRTKNKDFRVHVGGRTQLDLSLFNNDPALEVAPAIGGIGPQPDSIQLRRARLRVDGTMYEVIDWAAEYDFANTLSPTLPSAGLPAALVPALTDLWMEWTQLPVMGNFRVGNVKEPIGFEHLTSSRWLNFMERSFLQDAIFGPFNNGFNPGLMFHNWTDDERGTWWIGAFSNNSNPFGYGIGDDWALTGRATWLPYYDEPSNGRYLWHLGVAGSVRHPDEDLVRIRTRGNIRSGPPGPLNPIYGDTGTMQADSNELIALENVLIWGPWTLQSEYVGAWVHDAVQPFTPESSAVSRGTPFFQGGYVELLYFLTGESRPYNRRLGALDRVIPFENAFCVDGRQGRCKGRGAWQIGTRYSAIDLNDNGINGGMLQAGTVGLNWWLNPNAHVVFNYDLTHRSQVNQVEPGFVNGFGVRFAHDF